MVTRGDSYPEGRRHDYHREATVVSSSLVCGKQKKSGALEQEKSEDHEGERQVHEQETQSGSTGHWRAGCPAWRTREHRVCSAALIHMDGHTICGSIINGAALFLLLFFFS